MHDDKRDQFVDDLLEASLERYGGEEPRPGLEMRVLAGVRSRERAARRRRLGWAVAACAGTVATVVGVLHFTHAPVRQLTPSVAPPVKESRAQRVPLQAATPPRRAVASEQRPSSLGAHRAPLQPLHQEVRMVATRRPRQERFPTPFPLTEQEKLLLAYVNNATKSDLVAGTNQRNEAPITDLEIPGIKIAALEIKPLDDSQTQQGK